MKLIRFGEPGQEKPGVILPDGRRADVSDLVRDYDETFFDAGGIEKLRELLAGGGPGLPGVGPDVRLGPPVARPGKIICIGLNFSDHARESNMALPTEPIVFMKAGSALSGPNDDIVIPKGSQKTDWEVEIAAVIGKRASYVEESEALDHVAGYLLHNDVSERAFQLERGGQWVKGKSADSFAPMGPFLATPDELRDPDDLRMWLKVNGQTMQDGTTADMVFKVPFLVSYISQFMSLLPGDIISTGTPAGVGSGMKPPQFLKDGDVVELGIEGLGEARQTARAYRGR